MAARAVGLTIQGALFFLFIPLVLFLFLRQPLGPGPSAALGIVIMLGHRLVAAPWMAKFADARCLWCGRVGVSRSVRVAAGGREWVLGACNDRHARSIAKFLTLLFAGRAVIALGIFVPLAVLVGNSLAAAAGHPFVTHDAAALFFRVVVALTVVGASLGYLAVSRTAEALRCPFPLHNLFLLGIRNTLWVFRIVGAWWIVDALLRAVR
jgi:hypothetical protein